MRVSEMDLHDASASDVPEDVRLGDVPPEAEVADAIEQHTPVRDSGDYPESAPVEVEPADLLEQRQPVDDGEDEYR